MKKNTPFLVYALFLFSFIFIYLIFRAIFNEPLHDEVATFFNYIEGGRIFGTALFCRRVLFHGHES